MSISRNSANRRVRGLVRGAVAGALALALWPAPGLAAEPVSFKEDIHPILRIRCLACHQPGGDGYEKSGMDFRTHAGLMKGTRFGPMVLAGEPFMSNLMVLIEGRADKSLRMPLHGKKLTSCDKDLIRRWIQQGAKNN